MHVRNSHHAIGNMSNSCPCTRTTPTTSQVGAALSDGRLGSTFRFSSSTLLKATWLPHDRRRDVRGRLSVGLGLFLCCPRSLHPGFLKSFCGPKRNSQRTRCAKSKRCHNELAVFWLRGVATKSACHEVHMAHREDPSHPSCLTQKKVVCSQLALLTQMRRGNASN